MAHEGVKTDCEVWSLARKLKILGRLKLFRLVVTGVGRLQKVVAVRAIASLAICVSGAVYGQSRFEVASFKARLVLHRARPGTIPAFVLKAAKNGQSWRTPGPAKP